MVKRAPQAGRLTLTYQGACSSWSGLTAHCQDSPRDPRQPPRSKTAPEIQDNSGESNQALRATGYWKQILAAGCGETRGARTRHARRKRNSRLLAGSIPGRRGQCNLLRENMPGANQPAWLPRIHGVHQERAKR